MTDMSFSLFTLQGSTESNFKRDSLNSTQFQPMLTLVYNLSRRSYQSCQMLLKWVARYVTPTIMLVVRILTKNVMTVRTFHTRRKKRMVGYQRFSKTRRTRWLVQ